MSSLSQNEPGNIQRKLPDWYILKKPGDIQINVEEWYEYAEKRLEKFLENELWIVYRPTWMGDNEWKTTLAEEVGGHFLLRLAVAKEPRLISWLVEVEGDLFEFRFVESLSISEKISILNHLLDEENIKTVSELGDELDIDIYHEYGIVERSYKSSRYKSNTKKSGRDLEKRIAIRFHKIPSLVSAKKVLLIKGWAIVRFADIRLPIKRAFENRLRTVIQKSKSFLENDPILDQTVKPIRERIMKLAKSTRIQKMSEATIFEGEEIYTKTDCFPPCIYELISILRGKGHLSHAENWQLGTFLKKIGMTVDQQLRFWYENSIDNVGKSYDNFVNAIGYQIKHIYGKAGGGTDYEAPKCKTCIEGYFCYFAHKKLQDITEDIKIRFEDKKEEYIQQTIDSISKLIINHRFQEACARYFSLHTNGWKVWDNKVKHMLQYTESVYKRFYAKKESQDNKKKSSKEDDQSE